MPQISEIVPRFSERTLKEFPNGFPRISSKFRKELVTCTVYLDHIAHAGENEKENCVLIKFLIEITKPEIIFWTIHLTVCIRFCSNYPTYNTSTSFLNAFKTVLNCIVCSVCTLTG